MAVNFIGKNGTFIPLTPFSDFLNYRLLMISTLLMALTENFQQSSTALVVNGTVITILTALTAQSATKVLLMVK